MTANKVLSIGKTGLHISWKLVTFTVVATFAIILAFFKLWAVLDDGKDDSDESISISGPMSESEWEAQNPSADFSEKSDAYASGRIL